MNGISYIYTLSDPTTGLVRYIGQTAHTGRRYYLHLFHSERRSTKTHKEKWICTLLAKGLKPEMEVIWEGGTKESDKKEEEFISLFKSLGANLTNATLGGKTTRGYKHTDETKKKISEMFKGRKVPFEVNDDWKRKCKEGGRIMIHTEESKRKISESRKGKPCFWSTNPMPEAQRLRIKEAGIVYCSKKIVAIKDGVETEYYSTKDAERKTGCDRKTMRMVANGIYKQTKGYTFKFL